jgi:hypothetical protein
VITSTCWHCGVKVVIGQEEDIEGYKHGVTPLWIWDKENKKSIRNAISKRCLCLDCANARVEK